mgnify:CR=1 FL=1
MATIINNPTGQGSDEGMGFGLIVGILITIFLVFLFFTYGMPALRDNQTEKQPATQKIEIQLPSTTQEPKPAQ